LNKVTNENETFDNNKSVLAERIFQRIYQSPECDVIVYNAMLKGYLQNHQAERCFEFADQMRSKISPDYVTYILLLNGKNSIPIK
jgi:pentatricopeptide repeat protein